MADSRDSLARDALAHLTLALVEIPSVTGDEGPLCDWIEAFVGRVSAQATVCRHGNVLIVEPPARAARPVVGLFGHLDTVPPADDQPAAIAGGKVFGRGAADMKAGLAWMLHLLEAPVTFDKARPVLVFYDREEGPMEENGLIPLLQEKLLPPLDLALVLEPTDNRIEAGCSGSIHVRVTIVGEAAHSARPWLGSNAVYRALPLLERLGGMVRQPVQVGELTYHEVMSVTQLATSNARNVIPPKVEANVNYRFAPGKRIEEACAEVARVIESAFDGGRVPAGSVRIEVVDRAPAGEDASGHPFLAAWRRARGLVVSAKQGWTDVARLTGAGIPAVNFGPGDPREAHQAHESVSIDRLEQGYRHLAALFEGPGSDVEAGGHGGPQG